MSRDCIRHIITLPWSARSPDLSPIEYIWDYLGWQVGQSTSLVELEARLQQMGNEISQDIIRNLYASEFARIASLIGATGGPTEYRSLSWHYFPRGDRFNSCQVIYSQFGLAIHQNDHQARRRFVEWAPNEIAVVPDFHKRILYSDEAHFWLNGYVNKQNYRIWSEANPQVYVETPLHPEKLTVWCALWAGGIIGPYFFKNDEGHNVTVNGDRYRAIITNFFIPELNNHDVQELWFQQDGEIYHTARATINLLKDTFGDSLISRFGPVSWPPRSCDLTPLDYFLWIYVKSSVYADKPQTLDHLEDNIRRVIADIRPQMLEKVIEN
ncbi:transposable element Tc3 transposase [Trichonephila clavipes]|uniref:Transposable element Tc3 transposase n=1 Tax=Trichonephila clavipes TaxID=2585209 RepID=A0A8X6R8V3_TRICX|nr:transposable element Tc3 transposase [Trichonephila clavipes]